MVTVANGTLLDFELATSHQIVVRATNALGAFSDQAFTIALVDVVSVEVKGGKGNDVITGTPEPDVVDGGKGNDVIDGGGGSDQLDGGKGNDRIDGGDGDDTLSGGSGKDKIKGGPGIDTVSYESSPAPVKINLGKTKQKGGDAKGDKLTGIENATGSDFADVLTGNGLDNVLDGRGGKDKLTGKGGIDTLIGGTGKDTFYFRKGYDTDTIADFEKGDTIDIAMKGVKNFAALKDLMSESDGDVVIVFGKGDKLILSDTTIGGLDKGDFHL